MKAKEALKLVKDFGGCESSVAWIESLHPDADAWKLCERGDWMIRFAYERGVELKLILEAAYQSARILESYLPALDGPYMAIEAAESWIYGTGTELHLMDALIEAIIDSAQHIDDPKRLLLIWQAVYGKPALVATAWVAFGSWLLISGKASLILKESADVIRTIIDDPSTESVDHADCKS